MTGERFERVDAWLLASAVGLSLALTLPRLAHRPVWLDEAFTVGAARSLGPTLRHTGGTMALYYLLITPVTWLSDGAFWIRFPSALAAAGSVAAVFFAGRRIGGRRVAAIGSLLYAASWFLARYGMEARGYALALLLVSLSWLAVVEIVAAEPGEASTRWWWLFAVSALLAPLAHGISFLNVPAQVVALLLAPGGTAHLRKLGPILAAIGVEVVLLFAIGAGEVADWIAPMNWKQASIVHRLLLGSQQGRWPLTIAFVAGLVVIVQRRPWAGARARWVEVVPALWAFGVPLGLVVVSLVRPYLTGRYTLTALPGIALVVASGLARVRRPVLAYGLCALLVLGGLTDQRRVQHVSYEGWHALVSSLDERARPGDMLLAPVGARAPLDYAIEHDVGGDLGLVPISPLDPIGDVRRFYDLAPGTTGERLASAPSGTIWVVERGKADRQALVDALFEPAVQRRWMVTGWTTFRGALTLVRLEPRPQRAVAGGG